MGTLWPRGTWLTAWLCRLTSFWLSFAKTEALARAALSVRVKYAFLMLARILPACSERSEVRLDAQRAEKRLAHWRGILVSACEQSGRASLPEIVAPCELAQAAGLRAGPGFILDPEAGESLTSLRGASLRECTLAIGPEGGWSPRDRERLLAAGYTGLRLGPRVLRTETAGIAAIAALQALCGDLG